ncbi:phosphonate ABC transporter, permease protein PhnE [Jeotgalibaca caeni]|uniref:phosphonate ABC transporter, permease protein PhnE n=1 Tax=Jeotgalibaca caeni TaxID=3028623 RepID=UPI00237EE687|nr:phosphonate ABC transporter, permease protein PhnE [Jeotgalibaca caeni]MDE1548341.1 phosphonate ABC transporter, permease protein PhnE [Jeotgalibaca caeni]
MNHSERVENQFALEPTNRWYKITMTILVVALLMWSATSISLAGLENSSLEVARNIINGILRPDLEFLFDFSEGGVPYLLFETISIAFLGTIVGAVVSIPFAFLSSYKIMPKPVAYVGRLITMAVRTVPSLVYGLMFIRVAGPGPFTGVLTMSFVSIGMVTKLYIDAIEDLDTDILESMTAMGMTKFEQIYYGILPQLFSYFLSIVIYRFDMNLRDASVLGLVGAGGIGAPLIFAMNSYRWNEVGSILIGLVLLVLFIEFFSTRIREKLVRG